MSKLLYRLTLLIATLLFVEAARAIDLVNEVRVYHNGRFGVWKRSDLVHVHQWRYFFLKPGTEQSGQPIMSGAIVGPTEASVIEKLNFAQTVEASLSVKADHGINFTLAIGPVAILDPLSSTPFSQQLDANEDSLKNQWHKFFEVVNLRFSGKGSVDRIKLISRTYYAQLYLALARQKESLADYRFDVDYLMLRRTEIELSKFQVPTGGVALSRPSVALVPSQQPKTYTPPAADTPQAIAEMPSGSPIPGRPGFVTSPYAAKSQVVDVTGLPVGMEVRCPFTGKMFRVPPQDSLPETKPSSAPAKATVDSSAPMISEMPYGSPIPGRPGFVNSPFAGKHQLVDVTGLPTGMEVKCPFTGKLFRVPPQ